jgi:hypothetical protein
MLIHETIPQETRQDIINDINEYKQTSTVGSADAELILSWINSLDDGDIHYDDYHENLGNLAQQVHGKYFTTERITKEIDPETGEGVDLLEPYTLKISTDDAIFLANACHRLIRSN